MARWRIGLGKAIPLLIFGLIFLATTVYVSFTFDAEGMLSDTAPEVGEKVKVSYEPENPERARVIIAVRALDTWFQRLLILGSALMTLAGLNAIVRRFAEQPETSRK